MKSRKLISTVLSVVLVAATIIGTMLPAYATETITDTVTTNTSSDTVATPSDTPNTPTDTPDVPVVPEEPEEPVVPEEPEEPVEPETPSTPSDLPSAPPVHIHNWNLTRQSDASTHYYVCFDCGARDEVTTHTYNTAGNCTVCGYHNAAAVITPVATPAPETTPEPETNEEPADEPAVEVEEIAVEVTEPETENAYAATVDTENLAEAVLTEDELALAAEGEEVKVVLEVADISETVAEDDKQLVEAALGENTVALYLDINLFKQVGSNEAVQVKETNGKVKIEVELPADLINNDEKVEREYKVIRVHEGETTVLDAAIAPATGKLVFETDAFSTYSVVYKDTALETTVPDTQPEESKSGSPMPWIIAAAVVVVAAVVVLKKKKA